MIINENFANIVLLEIKKSQTKIDNLDNTFEVLKAADYTPHRTTFLKFEIQHFSLFLEILRHSNCNVLISYMYHDIFISIIS